LENVVLDMRVSTSKMPPSHVVCTKEDGKVSCRIIDVATNRKIAEFKVSEELQAQIPQLLDLYIRR